MWQRWGMNFAVGWCIGRSPGYGDLSVLASVCLQLQFLHQQKEARTICPGGCQRAMGSFVIFYLSCRVSGANSLVLLFVTIRLTYPVLCSVGFLD